MKIKMLTGDFEGDKDYKFHDLYVDENLIQGFFIPKDSDENEDEIVSILYPSMDIVSVMATKELKEFLVDKFVDNTDVDS